jgi:hypothetical protein
MFPTKILDSTFAPKITSVLPIYRDNGMLPFGGYYLALLWLRPADIIVVASFYIAREGPYVYMVRCHRSTHSLWGGYWLSMFRWLLCLLRKDIRWFTKDPRDHKLTIYTQIACYFVWSVVCPEGPVKFCRSLHNSNRRIIRKSDMMLF